MIFGDIVIHPDTRTDLQQFLQSPSHAVLLEGPIGNGKTLIAKSLAAELLSIAIDALETFSQYRELTPIKDSITIEQIRELGAFLSLKAPGTAAIRRVVFLPDADRMTLPAQHALLKLLEEPPLDTVIIVSSSTPTGLLATIRSRLQHILVKRPNPLEIEKFLSKFADVATVRQSLLMADGNIAGAYLQLREPSSDGNSLVTLPYIKSMLGTSLFEQLRLIETDLKDKDTAKEFVDTLASVSRISLLQAASSSRSASQWQRISQASYTAEAALVANANPKLVLTELMLSLRA